MRNIDNYIKLQNLRSKIISEYFQVYDDYKMIDSLDLGSEDDITLDFVSCTICSAKKNIMSGEVDENYVMYQQCLRNNQLDSLKSKNSQSVYMSFFTMLGGYHYIRENEDWSEEYNKIVCKQFSFFRKLYPTYKIRLTIPEQYRERLPISNKTLKELMQNDCEIIYSNKDEKNLKWKYGIEHVIGYGTRWEVCNQEGIYINCGNDIILFRNNMAIGIDFGSGLETLVSVYNGKKSLLYSNIICSDFVKELCFNNVYNEKMIDCMTSLLCILNCKKYKSFRIKYLIYFYLKIISAVTIINNLDDTKIIQIIKELCNNLDIKDGLIFEEIINKIHEQQEFFYNLLISPKYEILVNFQKTGRLPFRLRKYKKNITEIEIYALELMKEREKENVKSRKIEKRG